MVVLSIWLLLTITSAISAHIETLAYTSLDSCQAHARSGQRCVEFRSSPIDSAGRPQTAELGSTANNTQR